jgi:hypothetical protein
MRSPFMATFEQREISTCGSARILKTRSAFGGRSYDSAQVPRRVDHAQNFDEVEGGSIEDDVLLEAGNRPGTDVLQIGMKKPTAGSNGREGLETTESGLRLVDEPESGVDTVLSDMACLLVKVALGQRTDDDASTHAFAVWRTRSRI